MKKFAIAAATATALTLTMANAAFAQTSAQAPMVQTSPMSVCTHSVKAIW